MKKFKVGDRICAYYNEAPHRCVGTVVRLIRHHIEFKTADGQLFGAHYKQARKLVKKKKERLGPVEVAYYSTLYRGWIVRNADNIILDTIKIRRVLE